MAPAALPDRVGKPLVWLAAATPLGVLARRTLGGDLGVNPIETLTDFTGTTAFVLLLVTLAVTPVRRLSGWNRLVRYRRMLGLWAFTYAALHFLVWGLFDHQFNPATIVEDVVERPFITVGFTAFVILVALAATSPTAVLRWMGGRRWQRLHRLVYLAAGLAALHFLWAVKVITLKPIAFAVVLGLLLAVRLMARARPQAG